MYGNNRGNGLRDLIDFAAIGGVFYVLLRHLRIKRHHHLLLLAAVAVMVLGVIFGFALGGEHTNNCGVPRSQLIAGIEHQASAAVCTVYLVGAWFGGLLVLAGIILALTCLTWVKTGTGPSWLRGDIGGAPRGYARVPIPPNLRAAVWLRDGGHCTVCGQPAMPGNALVYDHVFPVALGGATVLGNLRLVHRTLNAAKSDHWPWIDSPRYCLAA